MLKMIEVNNEAELLAILKLISEESVELSRKNLICAGPDQKCSSRASPKNVRAGPAQEFSDQPKIV